ncbi:hypothetical protein [Rathayibacter sp. AY1A7]|uniref:hypothetical protein n=1 Tax=Rathayibacter sp. AY1A7 TaxID=2080524 RepID=UPI000CE7308A|nr:hypothetical protein [Rathayibacter sp. AY1A7]PPF21019.1 hypothetical protein C5B95_06300 [Rathayibacter sp. AY1A7]
MAQTSAIAHGADPDLIPCPACEGDLRAEVRTEWWPLTHVARHFHRTEEDLAVHPDVQLDAFGRVQVGVPWATCMHCGASFNMAAIDDVEGIER